MEDFVSLILGAVIGAIVSYFLALQRARLELQVKIDEATRTDRLEAYKKIWKMTSLLPKYPLNTEVTYRMLHDLALQFRNWYFNDGGIYLSHPSRDAYFKAQEMLIALSEGKDETLDLHVSAEDYEQMRRTLSRLRTRLTEDVQSRRRPDTGEERFEE